MLSASKGYLLRCFVNIFLLALYDINLLNAMDLKYQADIDNFELSIDCPNAVAIKASFTAYRFSYDPISHELNFLPNVVFSFGVVSDYVVSGGKSPDLRT